MNRTFIDFCFSLTGESMIKLLNWATDYSDHVAFLNSNCWSNDPFGKYQSLMGVGMISELVQKPGSNAFDELTHFTDQNNDWIFGFLSYDLKNQLEDLRSENDDGVKMPLMNFFVPEMIFIFREDKVSVGMHGSYDDILEKGTRILSDIANTRITKGNLIKSEVEQKVSRAEYIDVVKQLKNHILHGDIYEINYCIEFFMKNVVVDPVTTYKNLNLMSPTPFSCFYKCQDKYLFSSTPERFLAKRGGMIVSQPIKGTIRRGKDSDEDEMLRNILYNDPKERSENVMIVDLVRNDLAQIAVPGSVTVRELYGIYTYPKVHQMISTITSQLNPRFHFVDAIRKAFPMGSMTGAPKIRAMELIEKYERTKRGLYSGAVGYIAPDKDFDFNVIIRSILYNHVDKYLSFMAGSAITFESDPKKEYEECLLKAEAMKLAILNRKQ
jgi:para-aminobenzoate synthetase component I